MSNPEGFQGAKIKRPNAKFRHVATHLTRPAKKLREKRGFYDLALLKNWQQILGEDLAQKMVPQELRNQRGRRVLIISCVSAYSSELSMRSDEIRARLNAVLGFEAIHKLTFKHEHIGFAENRKKFVPARREQIPLQNSPDLGIDLAEDQGLRSALDDLFQCYSQKRNL